MDVMTRHIDVLAPNIGTLLPYMDPLLAAMPRIRPQLDQVMQKVC